MCRSAPQLGDAGFWRGFFLEQGQNLLDQRVGGNSDLLSQERNRAVFDELIRPTNASNRSIDLLRMEMFHYRATETVVENVVFDRRNDFHAPREKFQCSGVHRFDPPRVDQGY